MNALDDLSLLRAFVCIAESGSISAAARTLKTPQPSLSRHLGTLEKQCGAVLLRRNTHRMSLTEAGHRLLEDAKAMLALADDAVQRLREDRAVLRGHLRLFSTLDSGQFAITRLIARFLKANPGVTAELGYSNRPLQMIREGCDAGVITGSITDESVVARPAGKVARYLCAAPELVKRFRPLKKPADLESWPWISLSAAHFGGSDKVTLTSPGRESFTLRIAPIFISEGVTSLREAARAALGVSVLPDWLAREDISSGRLARLLPRWNATEFPIHVIYPAQRILPARVRAFVDFAAASMTEEMGRETE